MATTKNAPPRPVLFVTSRGAGRPALQFKKNKGTCEEFSLGENSLNIDLSCLQDGSTAVATHLHDAKVSSVYGLATGNFAINFESGKTWRETSAIYLNRESLLDLREKIDEVISKL